ncbi:UNVERIFIED_CONTAM: multidrug transporter, partial [Bacillus thuringiensis]
VGSFTALLYVLALFLFRKSENINKDNEKGIAS